MTNIPDSKWLSVLEKVSWWVFVAIASAAALIFILYGINAPAFDKLPSNVAYVIGSIGILSLCLFMFQQIDRIYKVWKEKKEHGIKKKFAYLSNHQQEFLIKVYNRGSRNFEFSDRYGDPRWLEELINWNYIKSIPSIVYYDGMPTPYCITENGWEEVKKYGDQLAGG